MNGYWVLGLGSNYLYEEKVDQFFRIPRMNLFCVSLKFKILKVKVNLKII